MESKKTSIAARILGAILSPPEPPLEHELARARRQSAEARRRAEARRIAKREAAEARETADLLAAMRKSGFRDPREFAAHLEAQRAAQEQADAERDARVAAFVGDRGGEAPNVVDMALELSRRHVGGRTTTLAALMVEAGMAATPEEAAWRVKTRPGQDLAALLPDLGWEKTTSRGRNRWRPPQRERASGEGVVDSEARIEREHA